jgi:hypothetical protein
LITTPRKIQKKGHFPPIGNAILASGRSVAKRAEKERHARMPASRLAHRIFFLFPPLTALSPTDEASASPDRMEDPAFSMAQFDQGESPAL